MKKIYALTFLLAVLSCCDAFAMGSRRYDLSLVVVPERYSVLQVAFDLADYRNCVLVSYRQEPDSPTPVLHVWNGSEWFPVSVEELSEASFFAMLPQQAILVGDMDLLPASIPEAVAWCPEVWQAPSVQTDELVNALGRIFSFRASEWEWFAGRYGMDLRDENEALRKDSWYYHPYIETTEDSTLFPLTPVEEDDMTGGPEL